MYNEYNITLFTIGCKKIEHDSPNDPIKIVPIALTYMKLESIGEFVKSKCKDFLYKILDCKND